MIELKRTTKQYKNVPALTDFSYRFEQGVAYGILGVNGAGKSTLINCLTQNTSFRGEVKYRGVSLREIGYVPQDLAIYSELSVRDNLLFFASLYRMGKRQAKDKSRILIERAGLEEKADAKASTLSGGMKRKLNLITALVHDPTLLICDEVCVGVDPISRKEILEHLADRKRGGMSIIYTSHYLDEVEYLCDRILFLDRGRLVLEGETQTLAEDILGGEPQKKNLTEVFLKVLRKEGE